MPGAMWSVLENNLNLPLQNEFIKGYLQDFALNCDGV